MSLSKNQVGVLLRGERLAADEDQARALLGALGALDSEAERGVRLYKAARAEQDQAKRDSGRPDWWLRSGYVGQVGDIAPLQLLGRQGELEELADWCTGGDEAYAWWQAGPRAGKSALMAWLVLHPPPRTWVVSFFVTARLAGQADSAAFTGSLLDQLAAITREQVPPVTSAAARDGLRRRLLEMAAAQAVKAGRRLVLVVDGLDEDCGSLPGSGLASIAACLPKRPPAGLRVMVAGRPDPPVPADVDADHPLRSCRVRRLDVSPHATQAAELAQRELDEVLATDRTRHDGLGYDVLGLVTASGGGLGHRDLQELTGRPAFEIDRLLRGVFGRTIAGRISPDAEERAFLFTHETLREQAGGRLGPVALAGFAARLHAWADGYRTSGWPAGTPGYLLRGYPRMLADAGELDRLATLATDPARHHRMLDATGGDVAALAEISAAITLTRAGGSPDLLAALRLAWYRDGLADRNTRIPVQLPAVWAALGQLVRAEALARSITSPQSQSGALAGVAEAAGRAGDLDRAGVLLAAAEQAARAVTDPSAHALALATVAEAAARAGDLDRAGVLLAAAEQGALAVFGPSDRGRTLASVAEAAARAGDLDRAEQAARSITDPGVVARATATMEETTRGNGFGDHVVQAFSEMFTESLVDTYAQARALASVAEAAARAGDLDRAEQVARSLPGPGKPARARALARVAGAAACAGSDRAGALLAAAEQAARAVIDRTGRALALATAAEAAARSGDFDRAGVLLTAAEQAALAVSDPYEQARTAVIVAEAAARAGDLTRAEQVARSLTDRSYEAWVLGNAAEAAADAGDLDGAERVARRVLEPETRARTMAMVAEAAARGGELDRAGKLAAAADQAARSVTNLDRQDEVLAMVAEAAADAGDLAGAERVARCVLNLDRQARALASVAEAAARSGYLDRTRVLLTAAEQAARSATDLSTFTDRAEKGRALASVAQAAASAGDLDRAEVLAAAADQAAWSVTFVGEQGGVQAMVAEAAAKAGELDRAERVAWSINGPGAQPLADTRYLPTRIRALASVAEAAARAGDFDRAERVARSINGEGEAAQALSSVAGITARGGDLARAGLQAAAAEQAARSFFRPDAQARALARVAEAAARAGDLDRAERVARSLTDPDRQARALARAAEAAARAGDHGRAGMMGADAEQAARSVPDPGEQVEALVLVARAAARAGDLDRAECIVLSVTSLDEQARGLTVLASVAELPRARSFLAGALAVGRWTIPLKVLARVDPVAMAAFTDELARLHSSPVQLDNGLLSGTSGLRGPA